MAETFGETKDAKRKVLFNKPNFPVTSDVANAQKDRVLFQNIGIIAAVQYCCT